MNALSKRIIFILITLALLIASLVTYIMFIKPTYQSVVQQRAELASKKESFEKYQTSMLQLTSAFKDDPQKIQEAVSQAFPRGINSAQLSAQIVGFAKLKRMQVSVLNIEPGPMLKASNKAIKSVGTLIATVRLEGGYNDFKEFLQQIENNRLILDIDALEISKQKKDNVSTLMYSVKITSYYQTE